MSHASIGGGFWGANATCVGFNLSQAPLFAGKAERCSDLNLKQEIPALSGGLCYFHRGSHL